MHDSTLSLSIHTTCARLMLNLVDSIFSTVLVLFNSINCFKQGYSLFIFSELSFNQNLCLIQVEPIFEKGVDQQSMDEARILLGRILDAFVGKFSTFKRTIPQVMLVAVQNRML